MKRILLHVTFWVIYTLQDAIVGMIWAGSESPVGVGPFWKSLMDALLCLVGKFLFTYFLLEVTVPRIVAGKYPLARIVGEIVVVLLISIFVYRVILLYHLSGCLRCAQPDGSVGPHGYLLSYDGYWFCCGGGDCP